MTTQTFSEDLHPRAQTGKFAAKPVTDAAGGMDAIATRPPVTLTEVDRATLTGVFDAARSWHLEWLSEVRDGQDYSPSEVDTIDLKHLAESHLIEELAERDTDDLTLSPDEIDGLKGVFASAQTWHKEWASYVRDNGDLTDDETDVIDASHTRQTEFMGRLAPEPAGPSWLDS